MKNSVPISLLSFITFQIQGQDKISKTSPKIIILATGGTIAGSGESSAKTVYTPREVPIDDLLNTVPQIHNYIKIKKEQIVHIGSQDSIFN